MTTLTNQNWNGKRQKVGSLVFDERGHMRIFVTYCDNCNGKVACEIKEAEQFANKYAQESKKLISRFLLFEIKRRQ